MPVLANVAPWLDTRGDPLGPSWLSKKRFLFLDTVHGGQPSRLYIHVEWMPSSIKEIPRPYFIGGFGQRFDPLRYETLYSRGWTLQERLLSPRIIHYAVDQIYWECGKEFFAEDGPAFDPTSFGFSFAIHRQEISLSEHGFGQHGNMSFIKGFPPPIGVPKVAGDVVGLHISNHTAGAT
ncbi:hypothetical protein B0O99DRAFT_686830 [Bisporella sp. PMI_857]|nr:hypothetical protein B0O99DRAFT_686830 [Bisporella sp. PMI_857]